MPVQVPDVFPALSSLCGHLDNVAVFELLMLFPFISVYVCVTLISATAFSCHLGLCYRATMMPFLTSPLPRMEADGFIPPVLFSLCGIHHRRLLHLMFVSLVSGPLKDM